MKKSMLFRGKDNCNYNSFSRSLKVPPVSRLSAPTDCFGVFKNTVKRGNIQFSYVNKSQCLLLTIKVVLRIFWKMSTPSINSPRLRFHPLIPKFALFILPSSCYTFPCKLVTRSWFYIKKIIRPDKFE